MAIAIYNYETYKKTRCSTKKLGRVKERLSKFTQ